MVLVLDQLQKEVVRVVVWYNHGSSVGGVGDGGDAVGGRVGNGGSPGRCGGGGGCACME